MSFPIKELADLALVQSWENVPGGSGHLPKVSKRNTKCGAEDALANSEVILFASVNLKGGLEHLTSGLKKSNLGSICGALPLKYNKSINNGKLEVRAP